jgi:predicted aspartyl protease
MGRINGAGPFAFVLDTGAGGTSFTPSVAASLNLPVDGAAEQAGGLGGSIDIHLHRVDAIEVGPFSMRDVTLAALPGPTFESHPVIGLAGIDLFKDQVIWWDLGAMRAHAAHTGQMVQDRSCWQQIEANWMRPWRVLLPVSVNGVEGMAMLDTGAQQTIINASFAEALALGARMEPDGEITGVDGNPVPLMRGQIDNAQIGPWRWDNRELHVAELALFGRMGAPSEHFMLLGMDWLDGRRFAIDYGTEEVWLGR